MIEGLKKNKIHLAVYKRFTLYLRTMNNKFPDIRNFINETSVANITQQSKTDNFPPKIRRQTGIPTHSTPIQHSRHSRMSQLDREKK